MALEDPRFQIFLINIPAKITNFGREKESIQKRPTLCNNLDFQTEVRMGKTCINAEMNLALISRLIFAKVNLFCSRINASVNTEVLLKDYL